MATIQAIIWDFGGVLVHMVDVTPRLELAQQLGVPLEQIDALIFHSQSARQATVGELSIDQHYQAVGEGLGLRPQDLPGFMQRFWSADAAHAGVVDLIRTLRPHYKLGLLSNAWSNLRPALEERFQLADLFDEMVISAEVGLAKPDPRIYHLAVQRLGVRPEKAVFIDDVLENVHAARREGLYGIQFQTFEQARQDLLALLANGRPLAGAASSDRR